MKEVNLNSLQLFLKETVSLRHKGKTQFAITINGEPFSSKNQKDLVEKIIANSDIFKNDSHWAEFKRQYGTDFETWHNDLKENTLKAFAKVLTGKSAVIKKIDQNEAGSIRNSIYKRIEELPSIPFNEIDKDILCNIRYCTADDSIYVKNNDRLSLIGPLSAVSKDPSLKGLCRIIQNNIALYFNEGCKFELGEYVNKICSDITFTKKFIMNNVTNLRDNGEDWKDIKIELDNGLYFIPSNYGNGSHENALEDAADIFCIDLFWKYLPNSLFSSRIVELKHKLSSIEMVDASGKPYKVVQWDYFKWDMVRSGEALTEYRYLKNIFNEFVTYIKDDPFFKIDKMPRTYSDSNNEIGLFNYSKEHLQNNLVKGSYKTVEECKNIMLFKSWMNDAEFKFTMAWAYAAIHPVSIPSNIALLLWTGGGTGKSSFVAIIKEAIKMATNANDNEIYFEIKGNKFDADERNWVPDCEIGIDKAALINIDEATTESINLYKNFSGSAAGNKLNYRKNYENAKSIDIYGKFIFTTNRGLELTSDDGSLQRRIAIIKHRESNNIIGTENILSNKDIVDEYRRQVPMLLKVGKQCYDEIISEGYSSIDEYAMKIEDIAKNLKESTSTEKNVNLYNFVWEYLVNNHKNELKEDGSFRLRGDALHKIYTDICRHHAEDPKYFNGGFCRFIKDKIELFENQNAKKQCRKFLYVTDNGQIATSDKNCGSIWILYPLKKKYQIEYNSSIESEEDVEKEPEILDYTNRSCQDVVDEIIDPMIGVLDK
jgi:hypothetical protein